SIPRRQPRARVLQKGIVLRITASGSKAFRGEPVLVSAIARVRGSTIARVKATPLRPGRLALRLVTNRRAAAVLHRRRRSLITLSLVVHGDAGAQHRRL